MEQRKVEFIPSAFRHNCTEADIRWALANHLADGVIEEGDETTRVAVGFDPSANLLLEVMYHELEDGTALVFHAMKCRKKWRVELGIEE
ncbi:MAG: hypothetical protein LBK61_00675 [Spirochaetaceae bacterium]|jgi:hypothetical protein|nr:hypothetical protein [Spirochaetaceae bacterium]